MSTMCQRKRQVLNLARNSEVRPRNKKSHTVPPPHKTRDKRNGFIVVMNFCWSSFCENVARFAFCAQAENCLPRKSQIHGDDAYLYKYIESIPVNYSTSL